MKSKKELFSLPCSCSAIVNGPALKDAGSSLALSMVCDDDGQIWSLRVLFDKPRAFRTRAEIYCTVWHSEHAYETVCEVLKSKWVAQLRRVAVPEWREYWVMRHFMIFIDEFGCLEVVAESAKLVSEKIELPSDS